MQKDIQTSKGETSQQKFESQPFTDKPSVGETASHKMKEVGHDINASLKENVGVGVGNYPSNEDRKQSELHGKKFEEKKEDLKDVAYEKKEDLKEKTNETVENVKQTTMPIGHKVQEIAHDINATLKQNVGIGVGNYSSEVDQQKSQEHKEKYEEGIKDVKKKVEDIKQTAYEKKEDIKGTLSEKKDELYEKAHEGTTGLYTHRIEEVGHLVNAKLKETIGVGLGDYPSEVDRQRAEEHNKEYMEKVKESGKVEVSDSNPIVHKIKEVAHTVNANLKEMIGVGVGNYSSEVDRELSELHHKKYEEKQENTSSNNTNVDLSEKPFEETKEKLEEKLFGNKEGEPTQGSTTTTPKKEAEQAETKEQPKFSESDFPKL